MPYKVKDTDRDLNISKIKTVLMNSDNYKNLQTITESNMPRTSNILLNYKTTLMQLAVYYYSHNDKDKAKAVCDFIDSTIKKEYISIDKFDEVYDNFVKHLE